MTDNPLTSNSYLLKKFPGKGGWTYAEIPEIPQDKNTPFGWVRVRGCIDDFEIKGYHLMPMGNGKLFLPVRSEIRKKIKKQEGDYVKIVLYPDNIPTEIPEEFTSCLADEPKAFENFLSFTDGKKKEIIQYIYSAKTDETKVERIAKTIQKLLTE